MKAIFILPLEAQLYFQNTSITRPALVNKCQKFENGTFELGHIKNISIANIVTVKWKEYAEKQLCFFNSLAHHKGFHPAMEPHKWYEVTQKEVVAHTVCLSLSLCFFVLKSAPNMWRFPAMIALRIVLGGLHAPQVTQRA